MSLQIIIIIAMMCAAILLLLLVMLRKLTDFIPRNHTKNKYYDISETLEKNKIILVAFKINGRTLHFIVDSGCSASTVDITKVVDMGFELKPVGYRNIISLSLTSKVETKVVDIRLMKSTEAYDFTFNACDLSSLMRNIESRCMPCAGQNIEILGILGNDFMSKYGYVIDYENQLIGMK